MLVKRGLITQQQTIMWAIENGLLTNLIPSAQIWITRRQASYKWTINPQPPNHNQRGREINAK